MPQESERQNPIFVQTDFDELTPPSPTSLSYPVDMDIDTFDEPLPVSSNLVEPLVLTSESSSNIVPTFSQDLILHSSSRGVKLDFRATPISAIAIAGSTISDYYHSLEAISRNLSPRDILFLLHMSKHSISTKFGPVSYVVKVKEILSQICHSSAFNSVGHIQLNQRELLNQCIRSCPAVRQFAQCMNILGTSSIFHFGQRLASNGHGQRDCGFLAQDAFTVQDLHDLRRAHPGQHAIYRPSPNLEIAIFYLSRLSIVVLSSPSMPPCTARLLSCRDNHEDYNFIARSPSYEVTQSYDRSSLPQSNADSALETSRDAAEVPLTYSSSYTMDLAFSQSLQSSLKVEEILDAAMQPDLGTEMERVSDSGDTSEVRFAHYAGCVYSIDIISRVFLSGLVAILRFQNRIL